MSKQSSTFSVDNFTEFKIKMLNWVNLFNIFCLLDNHQYNFEKPAFELLLAVGSKQSITVNAGNAFETIKQFSNANHDWLFGHLCYDLKNETEQLTSNNFDGIGFSDSHFFVPEIVLQLQEKQLTIFSEKDGAIIFEAIQNSSCVIDKIPAATIDIQSRFTKATYIESVEQLQTHISRGDCYEVNFCQEFFAENAVVNPVDLYQKLTTLSPNPFAALYKMNQRYCICASPERYLKKTGSHIISQPIKGTAKRVVGNGDVDNDIRMQLLQSSKERSENVMVVDLVRNDLSKFCKEGSVQVEELFGIYSFPQLHQMISTIGGEITADTHWVDAIKASFPMGSMTGAPKKRVMELIEQLELTKRGLFAGSIGYINPEGDFDFNVIIRSILYNADNRYLSFQTGSAITYYSNAAEEYEECLWKAAAIKSVLGGSD